MQTLEIHPKMGVGPIRFGMTRAEVRNHLGLPDGDEDDARKWNLEDLAIDFDTSGRVAFIEMAESENFRAIFNSECLHELEAVAAVAYVEKTAPYNPDAPELGYTHIFPSLEMSLWRPVVPDANQDADGPTGNQNFAKSAPTVAT